MTGTENHVNLSEISIEKVREITSSEHIFGGFQLLGTTVCRRRSLNRFGSLGAA